MGESGHTRHTRVQPMMGALYNLVVWAVQPWLRHKLAQRARKEPLYGQQVAERFGSYASIDALAWPARSAQRAPVVWLHAVSLGETRASAALLRHLRAALPGMRLVLTHGTATGRQAGADLLCPGDVQVWQPWDTPAAVGRFVAHFQPDLGVLMETEVWPNLVAQCARAGVPLCLVNARMSEKTLRKSQRMRWLAAPAYRGLHAVWAQSEADAARLRQLGAPVRGVLGNFKFDATPDAQQLQHARLWRAQSHPLHAQQAGRPVLMLASSREGEEQMLLDLWKQKWPPVPASTAQGATKTIANPESAQPQQHPTNDHANANSQARAAPPLQCLIVPRHPQRFDAVAQLFADAGYRVSRRSQWADGPEPADIWLGDSLGEMALYFGLSDVALLGGSFAPLGGQNLIEAAACATPVLMGPHVFNFAQAADGAVAAGAALSCADLAHALDEALQLVQHPQRLDAMQQAALQWATSHHGAAQATAAALAQVWTQSGAQHQAYEGS